MSRETLPRCCCCVPEWGPTKGRRRTIARIASHFYRGYGNRTYFYCCDCFNHSYISPKWMGEHATGGVLEGRKCAKGATS